jgi:hypothetical protein
MVYATVTIVVLLALAAVWLIQKNDRDGTAEFGPWYPTQNENGNPAVVDFENHIPCVAKDDEPIESCDRIKFGLVLYRDAQTQEPTTYIMSRVHVGIGSKRLVTKGTWKISRGTGLDAQAAVYTLDQNAPKEFRNFWPIGDDILFILDRNMLPRVGDAAYGYALNRIPIGQVYRVPEK